MKVDKRRERLQAAGATAVFVVHDSPARVRSLLLDGLDDLAFPVLIDAERSAYQGWGLRRAPWWKVYLDPRVWLQYARLIAGGQRLRGAGADTLQLGGDFVVAPDGTLAYSRPQQVDDRPPVGELIDVIEDLAPDA